MKQNNFLTLSCFNFEKRPNTQYFKNLAVSHRKTFKVCSAIFVIMYEKLKPYFQ